MKDFNGESFRERGEKLKEVSSEDLSKEALGKRVLRNMRLEDPVNHIYQQQKFFRESYRHAPCALDNYTIENDGQKGLLAKARSYANNIRDNISSGKNILLVGDAGTGKDHILMSLSKVAFDAGCWVQFITGFDFRRRALNASRDQTEDEFIEEMTSKSVLWISDPYVTDAGVSNYVEQAMNGVSDEMYRRTRPIWISANGRARSDVSEKLGVPLYDRMRSNAMVAQCNWKSARKPCPSFD